MGKEELIACFQDTVEKSNDGSLKQRTARAIRSNRVYKEGFVSKVKHRSERASIDVYSGTTFDIAKRYRSRGKIAVLNFANPECPGGGVQIGAMAQEECLCRSSNLFACIANRNVYDEYYDCYLCPNNKILKYSTTNRDGYREYKSNVFDCKNCMYVKKCTNSKSNQKILTRHIWQDYIEEANHLRYKTEVKKIYQKRKETIERVFADAKEKHGMRYTKLRGLQKIKMEVSLIFSCMNLKKLANWIWRDTFGLVRRTPILMNFHIFYLYIIKMVPFILVIGTICLQTEQK